jgi:hypothetical protein
MSKSKRIELRETYMQGWYQMDIDRLLATTASTFIFDDPAEPEPVTRATLADYMQRWDKRVHALGGDNEWCLTHRSRIDENGVLTDWEWWQVVGTELQGAAVVITGNDGVKLERITYFDRDTRHCGLLPQSV